MNEFNRLQLKSLYNTRDLGGMSTEDGKKIKSGLLYRSGKLHKLPSKTKKMLEQLGINTVVDLRTESERLEKPDTLLSNADYINCPLVCTATPGITYSEKMRHTMAQEGRILYEKYGTADNYMVQMYRHMITDRESINALKRFFDIVLNAKTAILYHCNSGKDRVGICSMLIELLLGVDKATILRDYVASARFWRKKYFLYKVGLAIAPVTFRFKKILYCIMSTKEMYIEKTIQFLNENYGGAEAYCRKMLGLKDEDFANLKARYLV